MEAWIQLAGLAVAILGLLGGGWWLYRGREMRQFLEQVLQDQKKRQSTFPSPNPSLFPKKGQPFLQNPAGQFLGLPGQPLPSPSTSPSTSPKKSQHNYVWGYRVWNMEVEPGLRRWDVMGKTIQDIDSIRLKAHIKADFEWLPGINFA